LKENPVTVMGMEPATFRLLQPTAVPRVCYPAS
jgi:hypothetical protein